MKPPFTFRLHAKMLKEPLKWITLFMILGGGCSTSHVDNAIVASPVDVIEMDVLVKGGAAVSLSVSNDGCYEMTGADARATGCLEEVPPLFDWLTERWSGLDLVEGEGWKGESQGTVTIEVRTRRGGANFSAANEEVARSLASEASTLVVAIESANQPLTPGSLSQQGWGAFALEWKQGEEEYLVELSTRDRWRCAVWAKGRFEVTHGFVDGVGEAMDEVLGPIESWRHRDGKGAPLITYEGSRIRDQVRGEESLPFVKLARALIPVDEPLCKLPDEREDEER